MCEVEFWEVFFWVMYEGFYKVDLEIPPVDCRIANLVIETPRIAGFLIAPRKWNTFPWAALPDDQKKPYLFKYEIQSDDFTIR